MAIAIKFYCTQAGAEKTTVRCHIRYTPDALSFKTSKALGREEQEFTFTIAGYYIKSRDFGKQRVNHRVANAKQINTRIDQLADRARRLHTQFLEEGHLPSPDTFRVMVQEGEQVATAATSVAQAYTIYNRYNEDKGVSRGFREDCDRAFQYAKQCCASIGATFAFESFTVPWFASYERWMKERISGIHKKKKLSHNTIAKYLSRWKRFLSFAQKEGMHETEAFRKYRVTEIHNAFPVTLTPDEIKQMWECDLCPLFQRASALQHATATRDLFVFACQCGIRFSDWRKMNDSKGVNESGIEVVKVDGGWNLRLYQEKTEDPVEAPLSEIAVKILEKYNWNLPRPSVASSTIKHLQTIATACEIPKHIGTHTARRSFATNMEAAGVPRPLVMKMTGHKNEDSYLRYVGVTYKVNADLVRKALPAMFKIA